MELPGVPFPGANVPPALICVAPTVPVPVSVPPELTVGLLSVPLTTSMPPAFTVALLSLNVPSTVAVALLTEKGTAVVLVPVRVKLPPTTLKVAKPWYCWVPPKLPRLKLLLRLPPS
jgi:hypothetical protein